MESPKIRYGLEYKGRILNCNTITEDDGVTWFQLDNYIGKPWLLSDYDKVVMAKWASEDYYNSSFEEPVNPFHPTDLKVVKVVTITTIAESDILDELDLVNAELKKQGYAQIDAKKYVTGG